MVDFSFNSGEELKNVIDCFIYNPEGTSVGVHGLSSKDNQVPVDACNSILKNGLITYGWGGIHSNCHMINNYQIVDFNKVANYNFASFNNGDNNFSSYNIICAIPDRLYLPNGSFIFLGNISLADGERKDNSSYAPSENFPINKIVENKLNLPKEFILGYVIHFSSGNVFHMNENYIGLLDEEKRQEFIDEFVSDNEKELFLPPIDGSYECFEKCNFLRQYDSSNQFLTQYNNECEIALKNKGINK